MGSALQYDNSALAHEEEGYHKGLKPRQLQMIAIGGAIGTGLFMGAGGRMNTAGPGLFIVYAVCGVFVFFILRALGELVLHRPSSGSFVSYAREFLGEKAAYVAGWMYFFNWACTAIVDVTAIALYMHYWGAFEAIPQWTIALIALVIVLTVNMISVKLFGEMEFWAALIKVVALVTFLVVGIIFLAGRFTIEGQPTGVSVIADNGGILPNGLLQLVIITSGVIFAYAAVELVGTAAGETENPDKVMPKAINSVVFRIAVFYVGSLVLLALMLPYTSYKQGESPFVTFFSSIGVPAAGDIMNFVVLTAAMSSLNAGLYSTGRILRSMALNGSAPQFTGKMTRRGVPFAGIALTAGFTVIGVILNLVVPAEAFNIALDLSALGIISSWAIIVICQIQLYRWSKKGILNRPSFRLWATPYTSYATLAFLFGVTALMCYENYWNLIALLIIVPALIGGWYAVRGRVMEVARERIGITGNYPIKADTPLMQELRDRDNADGQKKIGPGE
ncbi:L-asparagine permease AnsP1 [Mycolicibacterium aurum]|uniref:L-asparagine permease AnsP1 n=1 Tax=Mycolicibacterium aurum TaxID=1791 RepID=A0A3S4TEN6_MYCAU|nr:amino acid permease [Mycolicibacterium aurum]VEG57509.1 L-asparagine permease AnsP1 [Mycolicibacterium aurum]